MYDIFHFPMSPLFPYTTLFRSLWDTELAQLDKGMFGGVNPAFVMQDVFGVGVSAEILSIFYLAYMPLIPLSIGDRKSTRLNSSHVAISYAVFCLVKSHK